LFARPLLEHKLPPGGFTLEAHFNFVGIGTNSFDGQVAPTNHQFHMTGELTGGITDNISLGFMVLSAVRPGGPGLEYAGWRVLPHFVLEVLVREGTKHHVDAQLLCRRLKPAFNRVDIVVLVFGKDESALII